MVAPASGLPPTLPATCGPPASHRVSRGLKSRSATPSYLLGDVKTGMVFDRCGSSRGGRPLWMENILPKGAHGASYAGGGVSPPGDPYGGLSPGHTSVVGLRSLPPYHAPPIPPPSRYHYPTYTSPWLVRVSWLAPAPLFESLEKLESAEVRYWACWCLMRVGDMREMTAATSSL